MRLKISNQQAGIPRIGRVTTRPAPVKGLNSYDSIIAMGDGFALVLRNLFAQPYGCQVRRGYVTHISGIDGLVESLMSHNTPIPRLYAAIAGSADFYISDVTEPNATPLPIKDTLQNARWQSINFPNVAGVHMVAVNGEDDMLWFKPDGFTIDTVTEGDGTGLTIKGVDPKKLVQVYSHQKRLWFVEKDTTAAWYSAPDQITGTYTYFNPGINWTRGGSLVQIITWTLDDGNGADDHIAFISSEGEVSIYQGTDPSTIETWGLQGVYFAGAPVSGHRIACRYGGDILMVTQLGIVLLSSLLMSTKVNPTEVEYGKNIQYLVSNAASSVGSEFGWQPFVFPAANMVMLNVPVTPTTAMQFAMNDITKAWSEFIGYNAYCWELHQQRPFFGGMNAVYRAWEQFTDGAVISDEGVLTLGDEIRSEAQTSFSYFDATGLQKQFKMVRPSILSRGEFRASLAVNVDFNFDTPAAPSSFYQPAIGRWNEDYWDNAVWGGGLSTYKAWESVQGIGTAGSLRLLLRTTSETYWATTDWLYELGGVM